MLGYPRIWLGYPNIFWVYSIHIPPEIAILYIPCIPHRRGSRFGTGIRRRSADPQSGDWASRDFGEDRLTDSLASFAGKLEPEPQPHLVGGLEHEFYDFPYIGNNTLIWLIFFRGVETTNQPHVSWENHGFRWRVSVQTNPRTDSLQGNRLLYALVTVANYAQPQFLIGFFHLQAGHFWLMKTEDSNDSIDWSFWSKNEKERLDSGCDWADAVGSTNKE